jgi:very-short-patch-repair endonuclease
MKMKQINFEYLTEEKLENYLKIIFPNGIFIREYKIKNTRYRVDYYCSKLNLVVEFDGHGHYTNPPTILNDYIKENLLEKEGIKIIRFPYFVQMCSEVIKKEFGIDIDVKQVYNHGFIDKKVILPATFCSLGIERFKKDLEKFFYIRKEIEFSLYEKCVKLGDKRLVLPKEIFLDK